MGAAMMKAGGSRRPRTRGCEQACSNRERSRECECGQAWHVNSIAARPFPRPPILHLPPSKMSKIVSITSKAQFDGLLKSSRVVVVDCKSRALRASDPAVPHHPRNPWKPGEPTLTAEQSTPTGVRRARPSRRSTSSSPRSSRGPTR